MGVEVVGRVLRVLIEEGIAEESEKVEHAKKQRVPSGECLKRAAARCKHNQNGENDDTAQNNEKKRK
jgi:hypothetical protein